MLVNALCLLVAKVPGQVWEIRLQGGASGYMGDLNPENPIAFNDWSAAFMVKYNIDHTWGLRANFAYANIWAADHNSGVAQRRNRNLSFFGEVKEVSLIADFNFFRWLPQRGRLVYTPYIFAGIAGIAFEPKNYLPSSGETIKLRELQTEYDPILNPAKYRTRAIAIPFGAGFKYNLRGPWSVGVEVGYRVALTDYLDDVSGNYAKAPNFPSNINFSDWFWLTYGHAPATPSTVGVGTQRGDGRPNDSYMTAGITLSFTLFKGGCPEWR